MSKQDRQGVRTAADLERKYDFGSFGKGGGGDSEQTSKLSQLLSQFMTATNKKIGEIENALKGIGKPSADDVTYDNTSSSLMATNVRKAIDELDKEIEGFETDIDYSLIEFDTSEIVVEGTIGKTSMLNGTLASDVGFSESIAYPEGFNQDNCYLSSFEVYFNGSWRCGTGLDADTTKRLFATLDAGGVRAYTSGSPVFNAPFRIGLTKL